MPGHTSGSSVPAKVISLALEVVIVAAGIASVGSNRRGSRRTRTGCGWRRRTEWLRTEEGLGAEKGLRAGRTPESAKSVESELRDSKSNTDDAKNNDWLQHALLVTTTMTKIAGSRVFIARAERFGVKGRRAVAEHSLRATSHPAVS